MSILRHTAVALALGVAPLLTSCGDDAPTIETMPPSPPASVVGSASGNGTMEQTIWSDDPNTPPERKKVDFAAKFAYVYPAAADTQRTLWVIVADQSPDTAKLDAADDRSSWLRDWCGDQHAKFVAMELDSDAKPMESRVCPGDGRLDVSHLSEESKMGTRGQATLGKNDGKHIEGGMLTGMGSRTVGDKESIYEISGDYRFAADLAPATLRDRVLADGDEKASGVRGAKAAYLKYWKAAGGAKTIEEMTPWFTPERQANNTRQMAELAKFGNMAKRAVEMYAAEHSKSPDITAAKAIGAAVVVTSEADDGGARMICRTLLLQLQGTWKVGDEKCAQKKSEKK